MPPRTKPEGRQPPASAIRFEHFEQSRGSGSEDSDSDTGSEELPRRPQNVHMRALRRMEMGPSDDDEDDVADASDGEDAAEDLLEENSAGSSGAEVSDGESDGEDAEASGSDSGASNSGSEDDEPVSRHCGIPVCCYHRLVAERVQL